VEPDSTLITTTRQTELLGIPRRSLYYHPVVNPEREALDKLHMNAIDAIYTDYPFYGSRRMKIELDRVHGMDIGRDRIRHLMQRLGIEAIYPRPNTSKPAPLNATYPYLLRGLEITRPNQVWGSDITYVRTATGFVYLVAFIDWYSRYVVAWRLSDTMEQTFCLEALDTALARAIPDISNTDQGSHFTSKDFLALLEAKDVKISMDGRGRCMDNIFTERLWRTVKYENVFLQSYHDVTDARQGLDAYFDFYNNRRWHQSLDYKTPATVYFG
jgi:putative transposase